MRRPIRYGCGRTTRRSRSAHGPRPSFSSNPIASDGRHGRDAASHQSVTAMTTRAGLALALLLFIGGAAITAEAAQDVIETDRPDLTNGSHLVAPGIVQ